MGAKLKSIHIENFRSIRVLDVNIAQTSVFVGKNDCGKSNILRALNLFFNEETNPGIEFEFQDDYCFFAQPRAKQAREILVRLEIELPTAYHGTNGQIIIWTKKWREEGLWSDEYKGARISADKRGNEVRETVKIPDKSNVHTLLRKIEFEYIPAIKDTQYFDDLRGRIYGVISKVAARTFHDSSAAFEQSIGAHLNDLTGSIKSTLGFETRLALPRDLYHIFERLDFLSGEKAVSLNSRGDGIKARHIPLILKFMAEKKAGLQNSGSPPISNIWAYEEPENSLEMTSAVQLAEELFSLSESEISQIVLTTHSPIFYDLAQRESKVSLTYVTKNDESEGTIIKKDTSGLDESLGTLALLAPRITELVEQVRMTEIARAEALRLAETNRPRIFVEGESDRLVLKRAMELFFPNVADKVLFETKRSGGGHKYVIDMLLGWRAHHKHHAHNPKAVGIVDSDASLEKIDFNSQPDNIKSAKCFLFPAPASLRGALTAGFRVPITLEALYPANIWQNASRRGKLALRDQTKVCPPHLINNIIAGRITLEESLNAEWAIFVLNEFISQEKIPTANWICRMDDDACRANLLNFRPILQEALLFLGFEAN